MTILRGVHAEAKNNWLSTLSDNEDRIRNEPYMTSRVAIIKELASGIRGIGEESIYETVVQIEDCLGRNNNT